jgi:NTE family protein
MTDRQVRSGRQNATARIRKSATPVKQKVINLALQGGGAHGALAWRVLDRLLEDERIMIDGISATSAGAMNAAMVAYGWAVGGETAPDARSPPSGSGLAMRRQPACRDRHGWIE